MELYLGSFLLLLPFLCIAAWSFRVLGWRDATLIWGMILFSATCVTAGQFFLRAGTLC